jgi:hypothetical protein
MSLYILWLFLLKYIIDKMTFCLAVCCFHCGVEFMFYIDALKNIFYFS